MCHCHQTRLVVSQHQRNGPMGMFPRECKDSAWLGPSVPRTEKEAVGFFQDHGQSHRWQVGWFRTTDRDTGGRLVDSGPWTETQMAGWLIQDHGQWHRWKIVCFRTGADTGRWVLSAPWTETMMAHWFLQHHGQRHIEKGNCFCFSTKKTTAGWIFSTRQNEATVPHILQAFGFNIHSGGAIPELWGWSALFPPSATSSAV